MRNKYTTRIRISLPFILLLIIFTLGLSFCHMDTYAASSGVKIRYNGKTYPPKEILKDSEMV